MFTIHKKELLWGKKTLTIETGRMARQADGSAYVSLGETTVLATVVGAKTFSEDQSFFPLTVNYQEKTYAAGKIPGGFFKREGRPSEYEVLTSRLIDRPIRPLFPETFKNEVQVVCTLLSYDEECNPSVVALIAASAALALSGIPFQGPIGAARVGYIDGNYVLNPTPQEGAESQLELVVAGTDHGVLMVESEAKGLSEEIMLGAVTFGHKALQPVIQLIRDLAAVAAKPAWAVPEASAAYVRVLKEVRKDATPLLRAAYKEREKQVRYHKIHEIKAALLEKYKGEEGVSSSLVSGVFFEVEKEVMRQDVLKTKSRIDGRDLVTVRPITCEIGVLPRAHGSALFTRGETQALVVTTLGTPDDEQMIDALAGEYKESFMLHYNFPPFSVGEVGRMGSPGRREIGHGKLAWRALKAMIPAKSRFPYALRVVSEVLESNGSSSMATVCGASLSLMDAGVPLESPIAGIAMGLVKEGKDFVVLSDILGDEDHLGDMDFKVAGTKDGVTALQMDIKITSITPDIMEQALHQAKDGRLHILGEMEKAMSLPRDGVSSHAPQILTMRIPTDKIREVIGSGGKVIREICETTGTKISIEDDGQVTISAVGKEKIDAAKAIIDGITAEAEIGGVYQGTVTKIVEFGAFVNFLSTFGLVHVSEISETRVENVDDVLKVGDKVMVKVLGTDNRGKLKLSMKAVAAPGA